MAQASKNATRPSISRRIETYGPGADNGRPVTVITEWDNGMSEVKVDVKYSALLPRKELIKFSIDTEHGVARYEVPYMGVAEARLDTGIAESLHTNDAVVTVLRMLRDELAALDARDGKKVVTVAVAAGVGGHAFRHEVGWGDGIKAIDSAIALLQEHRRY